MNTVTPAYFLVEFMGVQVFYLPDLPDPKEVKLGFECLAGEGGKLDQVLVQEDHALHHLGHVLQDAPH